MSKSDLAKVLDKIEAEIYGLLKEKGFKKNGRTFNRKTDDGLIQVLHIQMGSFDPPVIPSPVEADSRGIPKKAGL